MSDAETHVAPAKTTRQVLDQCRVVAHLARQIAIVHDQKGEVYGQWEMSPGLIEEVGQQTAAFMEQLGNILNAMDAVDSDEDAWCDPIFRVAQATWPQSK